MKFGVYIHYPYCLQQCPYCDFATVRYDDSTLKEEYAAIVLQEIRSRNHLVPYRKISTIYLGGGTPSLAGPPIIEKFLNELHRDFDTSDIQEITLEINPGTITADDQRAYKSLGITRYSVGVQTFNDRLLKILGREHSSQDTYRTLKLIRDELYTLDLLFTLPHQTHEDLIQDLQTLLSYKPLHVSAYALTLPKRHPLALNRPTEDEQVSMFYTVEEYLSQIGLKRYEISSYALPGREAVHNNTYWTNQPYWGIGMSAHSYFPLTPYGVRFWNPPTIKSYQKQVQGISLGESLPLSLPQAQYEILESRQALTDTCHTRLRTMEGLNVADLRLRFPQNHIDASQVALNKLRLRGLVEEYQSGVWRISQNSLVMSEQVFQEMTFLPSDLS